LNYDQGSLSRANSLVDSIFYLGAFLMQKGNNMPEQKKWSIRQRWDGLQPSKTMLVWSCVGSVAVALIVGFTWGGWVTGGTARDMAQDAGDDSRYELASVICVEKFLAAPDAQVQLTELKAIDSSYAQRQFIDAGGWATMPGQEKGARQTAEICAAVLDKLELDTAAGVEGTVEPVSAAQ
jgi:hypothetical protein